MCIFTFGFTCSRSLIHIVALSICGVVHALLCSICLFVCLFQFASYYFFCAPAPHPTFLHFFPIFHILILICLLALLLLFLFHFNFFPYFFDINARRCLCVCVLATETYAYNYRKKAHRIIDFLISRGFNRSGMSGYRSTICFLACWLQKSMPTASFTVCSGRNSSISTHMRASERVCVLSAFYYYRMCEARLRTRICISYRTETWNVKCASERQNKIYLLK